MCRLCDAGRIQAHPTAAHRWDSRRGFLKAAGMATAGTAAGLSILTPREARAGFTARSSTTISRTRLRCVASSSAAAIVSATSVTDSIAQSPR